VVVDLSALPHPRKVEVIGWGLRAIRDLRRRFGRPHWVVLDEAHTALYAAGVPADALGIEDKGFCLVTYRPSWLREPVVDAVDVIVSAHTTDPAELAFVSSRLLARAGDCQGWAEALAELGWGEFVAVQCDPAGRPVATTFVAAPRQTPHVRHSHKYAAARVAPERRFFFREPGGGVQGAADSLQDFRRALREAADQVLAHHAGRGDFSRWVVGVFGDHELSRQLSKAEARWRRGEIADLRAAIDHLIASRYGNDG
jgi:hypothetical protein